jgi:hypothetical protein
MSLTVNYEVKLAADKMAKITIEELGSVDKAIDFHATQCRVHLEILAALCHLQVA